MEKLPLNLFDLEPRESTFTMPSVPDKTFTLSPWSLRVRAWAFDKFGAQNLDVIFKEQRISEIADIAYFMLKDKDVFPTKDSFLDAVRSLRDQLNLITALLGAIGIGEPEMKQIKDSIAANMKPEVPVDPKPQSPKAKKKTGAKSSTP